MSEAARHWISEEEYLAHEAAAEYKSEYFDGEIFAMAGAEPEHNEIGANVIGELGTQLLERPCRVYGSDQRVKIEATGLNTYPDVSVVCEEPRFDSRRPRALLNPILIVEVLSDTTEAYDRGDKFAHYRLIPSLQEYVVIASDRRCIERFTRPESGDWPSETCADPAGAAALRSIGCELSLARVYLKVSLPPQPARPGAPPPRLGGTGE